MFSYFVYALALVIVYIFFALFLLGLCEDFVDGFVEEIE